MFRRNRMVNIVGVGNALVDHEFQLTEQQLSATGLTKGNMTLATHQQQVALLKYLANEKIVASKQTSGGSAANSIYTIASLGGKSFYACRVGDDSSGDFYLQDLNAVGIQTSEKSIVTGEVTGSCVVLVTPDGERTMQTYLGTSAKISEEDIDFEKLQGVEWLYLEGYLAMSPSIQTAIYKLRQQAGLHNTKIAVSFSDPAVIKFGLDGLKHMLGNGVDVIFCNFEEALLFTGKKQHKAAARALLDITKMAVVTNGAKGCVIAYQNPSKELTVLEVETPKVIDVLDTNGAGDNFAGAFLYALSERYDLKTCGRLASEVASQVIRQFGARLNPQDYQDIRNQLLKV